MTFQRVIYELKDLSRDRRTIRQLISRKTDPALLKPQDRVRATVSKGKRVITFLHQTIWLSFDRYQCGNGIIAELYSRFVEEPELEGKEPIITNKKSKKPISTSKEGKKPIKTSKKGKKPIKTSKKGKKPIKSEKPMSTIKKVDQSYMYVKHAEVGAELSPVTIAYENLQKRVLDA